MTVRLPPIYPITDKRISGKKTHYAILKELIRGGATLVQIRDKYTDARELLEDLKRCVDFARRHGTALVVNDRCDLALSSGASGVHLGQQDLPPGAARELLGKDRIIGFSTHTLAEVRRSENLQIDYLGFGPVYATTTKTNSAPVVGIHKLRIACRITTLPVVAIGGICAENVREALQTGAQSVAVVSALMASESLAKRMEQLLRIATGKS